MRENLTNSDGTIKLPPKAWDLPIGTEIDLSENTPSSRCWKLDFRKLQFQYFENLNSGQTGWGVSFIDWLSFRGWQHLGCKRFRRINEEEDDNNESYY